MRNSSTTRWLVAAILAAMLVTLGLALRHGPIRPGVGNAAQLDQGTP